MRGLFVFGFTLVEILIALAIFSVVGGIAVLILFTTLQSATKADFLREIKQNGNYAISTMELMIRNALEVVNCDEDMLEIKNPDGKTTVFKLVGTQIASNSGMLTSDNIVATDLSFSCSRASGVPDLVSVSFTLSYSRGSSRAEENISIPFKTKVSLRTY